MDRSTLRIQFDSLKQSAWALQDSADAAAAKAGTTRATLTSAQQTYERAAQAARDRKPNSGGDLDRAQTALFAAQQADSQDTTFAQTAYTAFTTAWAAAEQCWQAQLQNPGAVEQV
jgi:hypothetical protein